MNNYLIKILPFIMFSSAAWAFDWGVYPNCNAPAIPLESHSWWHENGEQYPRHIHIAACVPASRDLTGTAVNISQAQSFTPRVMAFNNHGNINWARGIVTTGAQDISMGQATMNVQCQSAPGLMQQCSYFPVGIVLDPFKLANSGRHELRLSPNIPDYADLNTRQFTTLNFQINNNNGKPLKNYRPNLNPIARSWYTGFDYVNADMNYMDLFAGDPLTDSIPTVSGVVALKVKHSEGIFSRFSYLFLDPDFHAYPDSHGDVTRDPTGKTKLLYKKTGLFNGTYNWNTAGLTNGVHTLYLQTEDVGPTGKHAGALKMFVNVLN